MKWCLNLPTHIHIQKNANERFSITHFDYLCLKGIPRSHVKKHYDRRKNADAFTYPVNEIIVSQKCKWFFSYDGSSW